MLESIETRGIVLYNRDFREDDKLVKIFTEKSGKRMFFVKHAGKSRLNPMLQPLVTADMLLKINDDGLSYIDDFQDVQVYKKINADLFALSYATYVLALADASIQDNQVDPALFAFLEKTLSLMEEGLDYEVLTNIFEIQLLSRFGVVLNLHECCFCHRVGLPLTIPSGIVGSFVRIIMIGMRDVPTGIRMFSIYWISFKQCDSVS